jgi:hypothetical protein
MGKGVEEKGPGMGLAEWLSSFNPSQRVEAIAIGVLLCAVLLAVGVTICCCCRDAAARRRALGHVHPVAEDGEDAGAGAN